MPRPPQSEDEREQVRQRILNAAQELFDSAGIEGISMRAIGARVGLTASALYAYFPAKLDLVRALWRGALEDLGGRLQAISQQESDPLAALRALGLTYADFALDHPVRFRVLFLTDDKELGAETGTDETSQKVYGIVRQRVADAIDQGGQRLKDADLMAQTLWAGLHGVLALTNTCTSFPFLPPQQRVETMIDTLLAGLRTVAPKE